LGVPENLRGMIRNKFVAGQDKFGIKAIGCRFVNRLPGKIPLQTIFIVAIESRLIGLPIGRQLLLLVHHDELGAAPGLAGRPDISPEEKIFPVKSPSHEIVAGGLARDRAVKECLGLGKLIFGGLASDQQQRGGSDNEN
ncbi:MAG: hypothetical protein QOG92_28, partial [Verrucomicrobiota bacterium]|nr:hypothetical protein [Verrucomicrobiota bacterium]